MKKLTSSPTPLTLHHYRNLLEAEGIETEIKNEHFSSAFGGMPLAESTLWVVRDLDYDRAKQLIDGSAFEESPKEAWQCASCGEENEGQFAACWKCGAAIT